jgi:hypothetical protein
MLNAGVVFNQKPAVAEGRGPYGETGSIAERFQRGDGGMDRFAGFGYFDLSGIFLHARTPHGTRELFSQYAKGAHFIRMGS